MITRNSILAVDGGTPAVSSTIPPMYPGGMRIGAEERANVLRVLESQRLFRYYGPGDTGSFVDQLEGDFARKLGVAHALGVSSGTSALTCALAAFGIGPGDEVIVPAFTWVSTGSCVIAVGAVPVIADVDESLTLNAAAAASKITSRTRAIIAVHMRGAPAQMDALTALAQQHNLLLLEDVAQACGGSFGGQALGAIGDAGIFSLQFNKILTAGEGGMVTTNSPDVYQRASMFHDVAASIRADMDRADTFVATTCRMSELHAAVLCAQLEKLNGIIRDMRTNRHTFHTGIESALPRIGATLRSCNDIEGDTGLCSIVLFPTPESARFASRALTAEGVPAYPLFDPEVVDYHTAYHWVPIVGMRSWSRKSPWDVTPEATRFDLDTCTATWGIASRAVNIDISPDLTDNNLAQMIEAFEKVAAAVSGN